MKNSSKYLLTSSIVILFSLTMLTTVQFPSTALQQQNPNTQQFVPRKFIGFYTCTSTSPCPMGVADYGMNGALNYTYNAAAFVSWANFTKLNIGKTDLGVYNHQMTIQQNLVDYSVYENGQSGEYWAQDVPYISQITNGVYIVQELDNIWNFSSTSGTLSATITGNLLGKCAQSAELSWYYCLGKQSFVVTLPFEIQMVTLTGIVETGPYAGSSYVEFAIVVYQSGHYIGGNAFDQVAFSGQAPTAPSFKVGGGYSLIGLPNDAETVLCGPGGGSSVNIVAIQASLSEGFFTTLSGSHYKSVPHAWSAGTDTAETVSGVQVTGSNHNGIASSGIDNNNQIF